MAQYGHSPVTTARLRRDWQYRTTLLAGYSLRDVVAGLPGGPRHPGTLALQQILGDRLLDARRFGGQAEVLAQQRRGQDRRGRVGLVPARDVGRAAVYRLEHAGCRPLRVDVAT